MGPNVPPAALAGALESGGAAAGAPNPMGGGAPGALPPTSPGMMNDEVAMGIFQQYNISGPEDLQKIQQAASHVMTKLGPQAGPPAPPPGPPGPPAGGPPPPMPPGPPGVV